MKVCAGCKREINDAIEAYWSDHKNKTHWCVKCGEERR